jgi:CBS domain-containing protein
MRAAQEQLNTLPIRTRRVASAEGTAIARSVACPSRGEVGLETCSECDRLRGIQYGRGPTVTCSIESTAQPSTVGPQFSQRLLASIADRVPISSVMTRDVVCVTADLDVDTLTALLLDRRISAVPVVSGDGVPIGVVSKTDLVRESWENRDSGVESVPARDAALVGEGYRLIAMQATASDVMTPLAFTLRDTQPLSDAAAMMAIEGVHRIPVLDERERVVGIISALDIVRWLAGR